MLKFKSKEELEIIDLISVTITQIEIYERYEKNCMGADVGRLIIDKLKEFSSLTLHNGQNIMYNYNISSHIDGLLDYYINKSISSYIVIFLQGLKRLK